MGERQDIPLPTGRFALTVVLVGVTHPGNLGAICRSMLNYGFDDLRLVNPRCSLRTARHEHERNMRPSS